MKTLSKHQIEQLRVLLADYGVEVKAKPKPRKSNGLSVWARRRIARAYKGIAAADCKGVTWFYTGPLYQNGSTHLVEVEETTYRKSKYRANPAGGPWPSDIAAFYNR